MNPFTLRIETKTSDRNDEPWVHYDLLYKLEGLGVKGKPIFLLLHVYLIPNFRTWEFDKTDQTSKWHGIKRIL